MCQEQSDLRGVKTRDALASARRRSGSVGCGLIFSMVIFLIVLFGSLSIAQWRANRGWKNHRENQELAAKFDDLKRRITDYVDHHPEMGNVTWSGLESAGMVDRDDEKMTGTLGAEYRPISAASPDNAVLFLCLKTRTDNREEETRHYKRAPTQVWYRWRSPNDRFVFENAPGESRFRRVCTIKDVRTGKTLYTYERRQNLANFLWRKDSEAIAVEESDPSGSRYAFVLVLADGEFKEVRLPSAADVERLLPAKHRMHHLRWESQEIERYSWRGDRLKIRWAGRAEILDGDRPAGTICFLYNFWLEFTPNGEVTVVKQEELSHQTWPKA